MAITTSFVCFGELLWDILPGEEVPGGAPMNVAYHLQQLGSKPVIITQIGKDPKGNELVRLLTQQKIDTSLVLTTHYYPTGTVHAIPQPNGDMKYNIMLPVAWDFIPYSETLAAAVKTADYFIFGSLVARSSTSRKTLQKLLPAANKKVLDINLRLPHYNEETLTELISTANILKLNEEELVLITNWWGSFETAEERTRYLQNRFSLELIIVTKGAEGAMVLSQNQFYYHGGIKVAVVDTIGSGDSFLAAFLTHYSRGNAIQESLDFASRLGAFVAASKGAWPAYDPASI